MSDNDGSNVAVGQEKFHTVTELRDLRPFEADPLLCYLHRRGFSVLWVAVASFAATFGAAIVAAALSNDGFWSTHAGRSLFQDLLASFTEPDAGTLGSTKVPFLRDYPSIVAAIAVACAPWFVYGLFTALREMHSTLARNGCIEISNRLSLEDVNDDIDALNARFARAGERSRPILVFGALLLAMGLMAGVGMRFDGFAHLLNADDVRRQERLDLLFDGWWARPFLPGFYVWCILGALGLYMVYVEAVIGLNYTSFLRKARGRYRFRANTYNVDGYYGWETLSTVFSFLLAGVATTALSMYPIYMFLKPAVPVALIVLVLVGYPGMVLYVSIACAIILRSHVRKAKNDATKELVAQLENVHDIDSLDGLLRRQLLGEELRYYREIPDFPVATRWTVLAGLITVLGVLASLAQIFSVVQ